MKTKSNPSAPVATLMTLFVCLAILLSACGNLAIPPYGQVVTPTNAPTPTATALPSNAQDAAIRFQTAIMTRDSSEALEIYAARLWSLSDRNGCASLSPVFETVAFGNKTYKIKSGADIKRTTLVEAGLLTDAALAKDFGLAADALIPWEIWEVQASYTKPWPGIQKNDLRPNYRFVWSGTTWLFDGLASQPQAAQVPAVTAQP
ncbi:MAG: hypothetical protein NT121_24655 [Chloroflexi bacterium]|nr:hypothetical protein [Chloroflexota bacterium]